MAKQLAQVYLIHGQNTQAIQSVRDRVVGDLLVPELRDENLTDYIATSNRPLRLADIGWDIVSELSTLSLFPDACRVVVVTDLRDLCETSRRAKRPAKKSKKKKAAKSGAKKADVVEKFVEFLERGIRQTPNAIVFINHERDFDTTVSKKSRLYAGIKKAGFVQECKGQNKMFALTDALEARNVSQAIALFREVSRSATSGMIFNSLLRTTRLLLQARTAEVKRRSGMGEEELKALFPADRSGLFNQHPFVQRKTAQAARRFSPADLAEALRELVEINRLVIPISTDTYVRDFGMSVELWMLKWFSGR